MIEPSTLIQQHAAAIVAALVQALHSSDQRAKLRAARLLLRRGWGPLAEKGRDAPSETAPADGLSAAQLRQAIELFRTHLPLDRNEPDPAATPCPARQGEDIGTEQATTPCPAAEPSAPAPEPAPRASPPGIDSPQRDADPMSRALLLASNRSEDPFRRPLPQPPDMEPPRPFHHDGFYRHRRWR